MKSAIRLLICLSLCWAAVSCSLVPNATVRIALPPGNREAEADGARIAEVLKAGPHPISFELVKTDSFPPPDLVWFDGDLSNQDYQSQALGPNAQLEALAREKGVPAPWFAPDGDRILPLAWSPWAWWVPTEGARSPSAALVPYADRSNLAALALMETALQGPSLGSDAGAAVWTRWGTAARDEGKNLTAASALALWKTGHHGRLWLNCADLTGGPVLAGVNAEPASVVPTRVKGFWWNQAGWNRDRVPELMAALWSPGAQAVWAQTKGWYSATASPFSEPRLQKFLILP